MKQIKINIGKRGDHDSDNLVTDHSELRTVLERLKKKGLNPMQMCQKLIEHDVSSPTSDGWNYDLVVEQCKKLEVD
ncbi:MAG: hypothetical protein QS721_08920 [Candidatus Endonucleobacter sp. (ex Gigantidas childressi)]|nr:hypothetical protein [Candidatus Endonucleobacter sp. (ex Gigantidas childressi)]